MRLKKTTVLTGNHASKQSGNTQQTGRDRAKSDNDFMHNMFKNDLASHISGATNGGSPQKQQEESVSKNGNHGSNGVATNGNHSSANMSSGDKKYVPKGS